MDNIKVFLLSNRCEHYDLLVHQGIKNILWFKSTNEFLKYEEKHPDMMSEMDVVFVRDNFYDGKRAQKIYEKTYKKAFMNSIPYVEISDMGFTLLTSKVARTNLNAKDVFNILSSYKLGSKKDDKHLIEKDNSNIKVLFIGNPEYFSFVESYFNKQGISDIKCVTNEYLRNCERVEELSNYDVVISGTSNHVTDLVNEISDYLRNDAGSLVYLANFNISILNDTNLSYLTLTDTNSCEIERKAIYTVRDYNKLYQYILDSIMDDYRRLNSGIKLSDIKSFNDIRDEYLEFRVNYAKETERIREKLRVIDEIDHLSRIYMRRYMRRSAVREVSGLRFEDLFNGSIRISFVYEGNILARITFKSDGKNLASPYYKEFSLEVSSNKGYLINLGSRSIYDDRRGEKVDAPPVIREDDYAKVEGVYKKIVNLFEKDKRLSLKLK